MRKRMTRGPCGLLVLQMVGVFTPDPAWSRRTLIIYTSVILFSERAIPMHSQDLTCLCCTYSAGIYERVHKSSVSGRLKSLLISPDIPAVP